jgi:hypothetical protein
MVRAVDLDRQSIERRDFPIGRRGYDPAAVDAHLRSLAVEFEELQRAAINGGGLDVSVASAAGTQVHGIVHAAETAAGEIERDAREAASQVREAADRDAERTRQEALAKARAHVAAVAQATATLLERVVSMDGEVRALIDSLHAGAGRLAGDLAAVETNMGELYDAAGGQPVARVPEASPAPTHAPATFESELAGALASEPVPASTPAAPAPERAVGAPPGEPAVPAPAPLGGPAGSAPYAPPAAARQPAAPPPTAAPPAAPHFAEPPAQSQPTQPTTSAPADLDGARLIALNMALNGESRAETERYLAENFELPDRRKLVDEVYAAIEG